MQYQALCRALAALVLTVTSTHGYVLEGERWTPNRTVRMHLSFTGPGYMLSDGFTSWDQSATDALNTWNSHLAHMQFAVDHNSLLSPSSNDGDNSAFFSNTIYGDSWGSGVLAITLISSRNGTMTQTDVIFNQKNFTWDSYRGNLRSGVIDFHRVALHEFGHVIGLAHPDQNGQNVVAIMNSIISNRDSLQSDDIAGGQSIYSTGPAYLNTNPAPNLTGISTRGRVETGDNVMIGGFIIEGSQPVTVIIRSIGHSLAGYGIMSAIDDPVIELHDSSGVIAYNDDWISNPDAQTIASYHLDPPNSYESALLVTLNPGAYTGIVKGFTDSSGQAIGVGMFELFDLHQTNNARAKGISTRGRVLLNDEVMIGGFIIGPGQTKTVVVRAIGPSLASHGVSGSLPDPTLELHDGQGNLMTTNDDWGQGPDAGTIQSEGYAPSSPKESALQATLSPGPFTAIVRGANNTTGVGLVEVFDLSVPPP